MSKSKSKLQDEPKAFREAVAAFEILRRIGFSAEHIFFTVGDRTPDGYQFGVVLRAQGKEYGFSVGTLVTADPDGIEASWKRLATSLMEGSIPESELQWNWEHCEIRPRAPLLIAALCAQDFVLPKGWN